MTPAPVLFLLTLAVLPGCGAAAEDPPTGGGMFPPAPTAVPLAIDPVVGVGTVLQEPGGRPELCLGAVAESYPPQCDGVPLVGWSWSTVPGEPESAGDAGEPTRWGEYAVSGSFDGRQLVVDQVVPRDRFAPYPSPRPQAAPRLSEARWAEVEAAVDTLPGLLSSGRDPGGPLFVSVVHDNGRLQDWADEAFGPGVVVVTSALR